MPNLSVIILTQNEEENIARAINSVTSISKDIVVVDSGSTDSTIAIAKKLGAHVYERALDNFASQRNFANSKTKNTWVISMDADEEIPQDLQSEIELILSGPEFDAYLIPRRNIIFGKEIKHTRWAPDAHVWLYDKTKGKWEGKVHEEFVTSGLTGKLKCGKIHHSHKTVKDFLDMTNHYTEIEAERILERGGKSNLFLIFFYPLRSFIGRYFLKKGFLDGYHGFVLSVLRAFYQFVTWTKVWERSQHA